MTTLRARGTVARLVIAGVALARLARAARRLPPVRPTVSPVTARGAFGRISVVIPARDEAGRIGPVLEPWWEHRGWTR
jgi:hypothetical protein